MRFLTLFCLFAYIFIAPFLLTAQATLTDWNNQRIQLTRNAMVVLGTWGSTNVLVGAIGAGQSNDAESKAFYRMNLGWGVVNLGLAATGYRTAIHTDVAGFDWWRSMTDLQKAERVFLFNAGLDAGYVMTGLWLKERSKSSVRHSDRLRGFGKSIILQGAFLFVFDLGAYMCHRRLDKGLKPLLPVGTEVGFLGDGAGIRMKL